MIEWKPSPGEDEMEALILLDERGHLAFERRDLPLPEPGDLLLRLEACALCRTDLHLRRGELSPIDYPRVLGHQIIGRVVSFEDSRDSSLLGRRMAVSWLASSCEECPFCHSGRENLCESARFTGWQRDGGLAQFCAVQSSFAFPIDDERGAVELAPFLCSGLIGYRALALLSDVRRIGLYGFGASAHLVAQLAQLAGQEVFAFTRRSDKEAQASAKSLGVSWVGASDEKPPIALDGGIIFAPVGSLVPKALSHLERGGKLVLAGIHMSDIPSFPYDLLWHERSIQSLANLTREDGRRFFADPRVQRLKSHLSCYPFKKAMQAFDDMEHGRVVGSCVIDFLQGNT